LTYYVFSTHQKSSPMMADQHNTPNSDWDKCQNTVAPTNSHSLRGSNVGLVVIMAFILGMMCYIGSFYWDRQPLPEVSKKQKYQESDVRTLPVPGFEKNYG